jgi:spermidine synthase
MSVGIFRTRRNALVFVSITALGVSSIITQLTVMRELLSLFAGNELVIGVVLANWLLLTGVGSALGKLSERFRRPLVWLMGLQVFVALMPLAHVLLIRGLRNVVFIRGEAVDFARIVSSVFLLLLPYCLVAGFVLTFAATLLRLADERRAPGQIYVLDTIGDILGGCLFAFVLVYVLTTFRSLYVPCALNLACAAAIAIEARPRWLGAVPIAAAVGVARASLLTRPDTATTRWLYRGEQVVERRESRYGSVVVTRVADQLQFYENGVLLFYTHNDMANERAVHFAMAQHPDPKRVLLVSGGVAGTTTEILKYPSVERVDYVELDPLVIRLGKKYTRNLDDPRIRTIVMDGRLYVQTTDEVYDVVILDLPTPDTAQINRFFTREFFRALKRRCAPGAVVCVPIRGAANYLGGAVAKLNATLYVTLHETFSTIVIIPGEKHLFLASDGPLTTDPGKIAAVLRARGVENRYVNGYYLPDLLNAQRVEYVRRTVEAAAKTAPVNRDFAPVCYFYAIQYWLTEHKVRLGVFGAVVCAALLVYLVRLKPVSLAIFTTGFAAAALEVVVIIAFQVLYGYAYQQLGVIVTMFMIGAALGAGLMNRASGAASRRTLIALELLVVAYSCALPLVFVLARGTPTVLGRALWAQVGFPIVMVVLGGLVGAEFPVASRLWFRGVARTAAALYNADLIGACVGAAVIGAVLLPVFGLITVCVLIGGLNLVSAVVLLLAKRV